MTPIFKNRKAALSTRILDEVRRVLEQTGAGGRGAQLMVACSAGADSVVLLDVAARLAGPMGIRLRVCYVDHGSNHASAAIGCLRGKCRRLALPLSVVRLEAGGTGETSLRQRRLEALRSQMLLHECQAVLLGHSADDQVETILFRLIRGTGVKGLSGMPHHRDAWLLRPLLGLRRAELRRYLRSRRLGWVEDPSNLDLSITRNLLRHEILPRLREGLNPRVDEAILRLGRSAERDEDYFQGLAAEVPLQRGPEPSCWIAAGQFKQLPAPVQARLLLRMWQELNLPGSRLEQEHVEAVLERWRRPGGHKGWLDLPSGIQAGWSATRRALRRRKSPGASKITLDRQIDGPCRVNLPDGSCLDFVLEESGGWTGDGQSEACFDADVVGFPLRLRSLEPGDVMRPFRGRGRRKLARMLIDAKVPKSVRHLVPVLVSQEGILWLVGLRRSDLAPVTPSTRMVLRVRRL